MLIRISNAFGDVTFVEDGGAPDSRGQDITMSDVFDDIEIHLAPGTYDLELSSVFGDVKFKGNNIFFNKVTFSSVFGSISPIPRVKEEPHTSKKVVSSTTNTLSQTSTSSSEKPTIINGERYR